MSEAAKAAERLRESPFDDYAHMRRFIEWYGTHEHHSMWDDWRYGQAKAIEEALAKEPAEL